MRRPASIVKTAFVWVFRTFALWCVSMVRVKRSFRLTNSWFGVVTNQPNKRMRFDESRSLFVTEDIFIYTFVIFIVETLGNCIIYLN